MDIVNQYFHDKREGFFVHEMVCADGFKMSVQASRGHYCSPRNEVGPYVSVEVYPDEGELLFEELSGNSGVYGLVPVTTVAAVIEKHGWLVT